MWLKFIGALLTGRRPRREPPNFDDWFLDYVSRNHSASLDATLQAYIDEFQIELRATFDEPKSVSAARIRYEILRTAIIVIHSTDSATREYVEQMGACVDAWDSLVKNRRRAELIAKQKQP